MNEILKRLEAYYVDFLEAIPRIGLAILILVIGIFVVSWLTSVFQKRIRRKSHDPLMSTFLAKAIKLVLIIFCTSGCGVKRYCRRHISNCRRIGSGIRFCF
jgi:hypothetical protein